MRIEFRTLTRAISTLVILFVLVCGASMDASAQGNSRWGRSHNRGRHLGWTRGRRVGQYRRDDNNNDRSRWRRTERRELRSDRRDLRRDRLEVRRDRRELRRTSWDNNQNRQWSRSRQSNNWRRRN
ncbi:MAG: hypothetical protein ACJ74T_00280 [Pyrinomonadaceae bacterium]